MNGLKQMIVIRRDLKMRRGKEIAQGAHAALGFLLPSNKSELTQQMHIQLSEAEINWLKGGQRKVCVRVNSEEELLAIHQKAQEVGVKSCLIQDSGKTEFAGQPTYTCLALGPDLATNLDPITGELELM